MAASQTRYLYGDSVSFPLPYNALATVRGVVECAANIGALYEEIRALVSGLTEHVTKNDELLAELQSFSTDVKQYISTRSKRAPTTVAPYATELIKVTGELISGVQARYTEEREAEKARIETEINTRRRAMWDTIQQLMLREVFTTEGDGTFTMRVADGAASLSAEYALFDGISICFELENTASWATPPRVSQFVKNIDVKVGLKKKLLSKTMTSERAALDEYVIMSVELREETVELMLARRLGVPGQTLAITLSRDGDVLTGLLQREPGTPAMETHPIEPEDMAKLRSLWEAVRAGAAEVIPRRRAVRWIKLDDHDVTSRNLFVNLTERLIRYFRPIVREVAKRSPNPAELSLKIDRGDGRREEIYLKRAELLPHLLSMPPAVQARFSIPELMPKESQSGIPVVDVEIDKPDNTGVLGSDEIILVEEDDDDDDDDEVAS